MKRSTIARLVKALAKPGEAYDLAVSVLQAEYVLNPDEPDMFPEARSRHIPARVRDAVLARDGLVCGICRLEVAPDDVHLDHIKPWSLGGRNEVRNLRVTHSVCNIRKGARLQ